MKSLKGATNAIGTDSHLQAVAAQYLLELIMYGPSSLRQVYSSKVEQLMVRLMPDIHCCVLISV